MLEPHIHVNTENLSALKMHHILKMLGVQNNKFMLTVYDEGLMYINPFDKNLSPEWQRRVHAEIVRNYWYFLREIVRINIPGGTTHFQFNRGNLALSWLMQNNINLYIEIPRQTFKTGTVAARVAYVWAFGSKNSKTSFMANTQRTVRDNLDRVKSVLKNLPWYLQMLDEKKDISNREALVSSSTNNKVVVYTPPAQGNETQAMNKARGSTEEFQWFDEAPHTSCIKIILLNSAPAWSKAKDFAQKSGVPFGRIITSTPGVLGTEEGDFIWETVLPQCIQFEERLFYDQPTVDSLKTLVYEQSQNDIVYVRFTYKQLGFGEEYFAKQCRDLQNDKEAIAREVLLMWARRSSDSPFTKEQLDRVYNNLTAPVGTITIRNTYVLKLFKKPDRTKKYLISSDCSGMLSNDYSSIVITDPQTFEVVGTLRSNARTLTSNTTSFTYAFIDIMRMFPEAIAAIERNNMGIAIIDNIMTLAPDLIDRMYSSDFEPEQKSVNESIPLSYNENINLLRKNNRVIAYGFATTKPRRDQMMSELLGIIINELYDVIHDNDIFVELNNIIRNSKGRIDHRLGQHDDLLFGWLIGLWVLCYSKVLSEKFEYPIGYIRPMSLADDGMKRIEESDIIGHPDQTIAEAVKIVQVNNPQYETDFRNIQLKWETPDLDTRMSRTNNMQSLVNPSISDIADVVFGSDESLLDIAETAPRFDIDIDDEIAEDKHQKYSEMSTAEKAAYQRQQFEELDRQVAKAKMTKAEAIEKARNVKKEKQLQERFKDALGNQISDSTLDTIINTFLG
jgi:hypothetical protein